MERHGAPPRQRGRELLQIQAVLPFEDPPKKGGWLGETLLEPTRESNPGPTHYELQAVRRAESVRTARSSSESAYVHLRLVEWLPGWLPDLFVPNEARHARRWLRAVQSPSVSVC